MMSSRAIALFAGDRSRWSRAGDQLYVDLDISEASLPAGTRLLVGTAVVEVSEEPHTGCVKFVERFGKDAARMVNSPAGRALRLRGLNAVIVQGGTVRLGDVVRVVR
jgi:MOSC domain-containing protein YiiM